MNFDCHHLSRRRQLSTTALSPLPHSIAHRHPSSPQNNALASEFVFENPNATGTWRFVGGGRRLGCDREREREMHWRELLVHPCHIGPNVGAHPACPCPCAPARVPLPVCPLCPAFQESVGVGKVSAYRDVAIADTHPNHTHAYCSFLLSLFCDVCYVFCCCVFFAFRFSPSSSGAWSR